MLLVPVCGLLLGMLSGCMILVPDETASPSASTRAHVRLQELPAGCPPTDGFVVPDRLEAGDPETVAEKLLARLSDWANAGTAVVSQDPGWEVEPATGGCFEAFANAIAHVYVQVLYSREGDETLGELRRAMVDENLGNLRRARAQGQSSTAEYWLAGLGGTSASGDGRFLELGVNVQPGDSTQPRRGEEWIVLLKMQDSRPALAHVGGFRGKGQG